MADINLLILGSRVRDLRVARGLSQEKLAERADIHRNFVGLVEGGKRSVGVGTLIRIALAMDLHPSELLEGCKFTLPTGSNKPDRSL